MEEKINYFKMKLPQKPWEDIREILDETCMSPAEQIGFLEAIKHDILADLRETN